MLDALPAGRQVLVVCSAGEPDPDATAFIELIVTRCDETVDLLSTDPRFVAAGSVFATEESLSPVDAFLFTKTGD